MYEMNGMNEMHILHEAMSRARMPQPQNTSSEASRSARQISIKARARAAREMLGR